MIGEEHTLTAGYIQRHIPPQSKLDVRVALLDIAQDFLLAHLHERGVFDEFVVFKGGTALRKLYAGAAGRFSTDIDLAARALDTDRQTVAAMIAAESNVTLGPFTFAPQEIRGRWQIAVESPWGRPDQTIKLDVGPPCWLEAADRPFVLHGTHTRYGFALPALPCMRLEEILAEKIARLSRVATARDASDLVWAAETTPHSQFDRGLVRRLATLKVWVDSQGLQPCWMTAIAPAPFDPNVWLAARDQWDDEQIGMLTHPAPTLKALESALQRYHGWLRDLTPDEIQWARADARDRRQVIAAIQALPNGALVGAHLR